MFVKVITRHHGRDHFSLIFLVITCSLHSSLCNVSLLNSVVVALVSAAAQHLFLQSSVNSHIFGVFHQCPCRNVIKSNKAPFIFKSSSCSTFPILSFGGYYFCKFKLNINKFMCDCKLLLTKYFFTYPN